MPIKQRDRYVLIVIAFSLVYGVSIALELTYIAHGRPLDSALCGIAVFALFLYFFRPKRWQR
jgi:hypothetical protein